MTSDETQSKIFTTASVIDRRNYKWLSLRYAALLFIHRVWQNSIYFTQMIVFCRHATNFSARNSEEYFFKTINIILNSSFFFELFYILICLWKHVNVFCQHFLSSSSNENDAHIPQSTWFEAAFIFLFRLWWTIQIETVFIEKGHFSTGPDSRINRINLVC